MFNLFNPVKPEKVTVEQYNAINHGGRFFSIKAPWFLRPFFKRAVFGDYDDIVMTQLMERGIRFRYVTTYEPSEQTPFKTTFHVIDVLQTWPNLDTFCAIIAESPKYFELRGFTDYSDCMRAMDNLMNN